MWDTLEHSLCFPGFTGYKRVGCLEVQGYTSSSRQRRVSCIGYIFQDLQVLFSRVEKGQLYRLHILGFTSSPGWRRVSYSGYIFQDILVLQGRQGLVIQVPDSRIYQFSRVEKGWLLRFQVLGYTSSPGQRRVGCLDSRFQDLIVLQGREGLVIQVPDSRIYQFSRVKKGWLLRFQILGFTSSPGQRRVGCSGSIFQDLLVLQGRGGLVVQVPDSRIYQFSRVEKGWLFRFQILGYTSSPGQRRVGCSGSIFQDLLVLQGREGLVVQVPDSMIYQFSGVEKGWLFRFQILGFTSSPGQRRVGCSGSRFQDILVFQDREGFVVQVPDSRIYQFSRVGQGIIEQRIIGCLGFR